MCVKELAHALMQCDKKMGEQKVEHPTPLRDMTDASGHGMGGALCSDAHRVVVQPIPLVNVLQSISLDCNRSKRKLHGASIRM